MKRYYVMGLFSNFEEAFAAISDIRDHKIAGVTVDDVTLKSPIEHPEIEEVLGDRGSPVPKFTLFGSLFGMVFGFLFLAAAQATFLVQPQGGKPVIPLPTNFVLMYEMLIFFAVWTTVIVFIFLSGLGQKRGTLYSEKLTVDEIGIVVEIDDERLDSVKNFFKNNKALEIREEKV